MKKKEINKELLGALESLLELHDTGSWTGVDPSERARKAIDKAKKEIRISKSYDMED